MFNPIPETDIPENLPPAVKVTLLAFLASVNNRIQILEQRLQRIEKGE